MRAVVGLFAATLLLAACQGDPDPKEPDPTTASSSTPTSAAPTMPAQAKEDSDEGAVAFVLFYVDLLNHASNTGETAALEGATDGACKACKNYIELYASTYSKGGYFRDSDWVLGDLSVRDEGSKRLVFAQVTAPPGTYRETAEAKVMPGQAEDFEGVFVPKRVGSNWVMSEIGRES